MSVSSTSKRIAAFCRKRLHPDHWRVVRGGALEITGLAGAGWAAAFELRDARRTPAEIKESGRYEYWPHVAVESVHISVGLAIWVVSTAQVEPIVMGHARPLAKCNIAAMVIPVGLDWPDGLAGHLDRMTAYVQEEMSR